MRRLLVTAALCAGLPALAGCGSSGAKNVADHYLSAWSSGNLTAAAKQTTDPAAALRSLTDFATTLHLASVRTRLGTVETHGSTAVAAYDVAATLRGAGTWHYAGRLQLTRADGHWTVAWAATDINPNLRPGTHIGLVRSMPPRAPLLDRRRRPLFTTTDVVNVGLEPDRLGTHAADTISTVATVLGVDRTALSTAVSAAKPTAFVPVITLRRPAYEKVKPRIYSLPGTVFTTGTQLLPPSTGFGRALLGSVGPATADVLKATGGAYVAGDVLGLSGLQAVYQRRLSGTATSSVVVRSAGGAVVETLDTFAGTRGSPVSTTLDIDVQQAAEEALAHERLPAALVAVDVHTGDVLAAANTPDATSFDRAISGGYPPGSTFKLVTTYALLHAGVTPSTVVPCPAKTTIDGKVFTNFEHESGGASSFADDFARSCNTAFIDASRRLTRDALEQSASALGVGADWNLPVDAFSGSVPTPSDAVEHAADAIGQGKVEVSPLSLAIVAAAIADGRPHAPVLVTEPAQKATAPMAPLDLARVTTLRALMRLVVTSGTAAGAHLPPATFGKTGTAEFGAGNPPKTHAWFVGYRGSLAFAVLVEGGGVGGAVAAPVAASFLRRVGESG